MNERIRELKDKIWTEEYWTNPNTDKLLPAQLNRFAELIVLECVSVVDSMADPEDSERYFWAIQNASQKIKQHFGVEE
jgi:acetoacetate decarboxylase